MAKPKEKDVWVIKEWIVLLQNKVMEGELKVSKELLDIFDIFSQTDESHIKQEAEALKKYHPKEYKEYLTLLTQIKKKEKPTQSVEQQKNMLMEDALIMWNTQDYVRENLKKNPIGEQHEKEYKAARKEFEEVFDSIYQDKKITFWDKEAVYGWLSFRAGYNNYDVMFLYHQRAWDAGYPLQVKYVGENIVIEPNRLSVTTNMLDAESKKMLEEMFLYYCTHKKFKEYRKQKSTQNSSQQEMA